MMKQNFINQLRNRRFTRGKVKNTVRTTLVTTPKQLTKSQKRRNKKKIKTLLHKTKTPIGTLEGRRKKRPPRDEDNHFHLPPSFAAGKKTEPNEIFPDNDEPGMSVLASALGVETERSDHSLLLSSRIMRNILEATTAPASVDASSLAAYRRLKFRDLFEWETAFCETEERFRLVMARKRERARAAMEAVVEREGADFSYRNPNASIMTM